MEVTHSHVGPEAAAEPDTASATGTPARTNPARQLHRTVGNQAMQTLYGAGYGAGLPQPRATVSPPDGPGEQEAEHIARHAAEPGPVSGRALAPSNSSVSPVAPISHAVDAVPERVLATKLKGLEGAGLSLPPELKNEYQTTLRKDLGDLRIHVDDRAGRLAQSLNANAFAYGRHIVFGQGKYAPTTHEGRRLLTHEVVHTLQQQSAPLVQRNGGDSVIVFTGSGDPLDQYSRLREAISPDDWSALNNAARLREQQAVEQATVPQDPSMRYLTEIEVPLRALIEPRPKAEGGAQANWEDQVFDRALEDLRSSSRVQSRTLAPIIQQELLRRWVDKDPALLDQNVRVALVDPEGTLGGQSALTFQFNDNPIQTVDGKLYLAHIDRAGPETLESIQEDVRGSLQTLSKAIELAYAIEDTRNLMARGHYELAANALTQRMSQLRSMQESGAGGGERVTQQATRLRTFLDDEFASFIEAQGEYEKEHPRKQSYGEIMVAAAKANERSYSPYSGNVYAGYGLANILTGGAVEESRQAHEAYRRGDISQATLDELSDALFWRGALHLGIMAALTIASMGLAGVVLGPGAGLGAQMLYLGGTSALTTATTMTATSLYTSSRQFSDPWAQSLWSQGEYTAGQIALSSAISFGIGAAIPVVGWLGRGANAQTAMSLAAASEAGGPLPSIPGVEASVVRPGVVAIRVPGQTGVMEVTRDGWRVLAQAGQKETAIAAGNWADEMAQPLAQSPGVYTMQGQMYESPFALGVSPRGWAVASPYGARPLQFGPWEELILPGTAPGGGTGLSSLAPSAGTNLLLPESFSRGSSLLAPGSLSGTALARTPSSVSALATIQTADQMLALPAGRGLAALPEPSIAPSEYPLMVRPSTDVELWGDPGWERVPGNALVRSRTTGERRYMWQWYEDQVTRQLGAAPTETQVRVALPQPMQFPGRSEAQSTIILDNRLQTGELYAEAKVRNWAYTSNVEDLIGSIQRMFVAQEIEAATLTSATPGRITVITARDIPVEVQRTVARRIMEWLIRTQGMTTQEAQEAMARITFMHLRPAAPP